MGWASRSKRNPEALNRPKTGRPGRLQPKQDPRLSERLVDLIAPYREDHLGLKGYQALIGTAVAAWNLALLPERERERAFREAVAGAPARDRDAVAEILAALVRRKGQLFPGDGRPIVHWEVSESADQYHVSVASIAV